MTYIPMESVLHQKLLAEFVPFVIDTWHTLNDDFKLYHSQAERIHPEAYEAFYPEGEPIDEEQQLALNSFTKYSLEAMNCQKFIRYYEAGYTLVQETALEDLDVTHQDVEPLWMLFLDKKKAEFLELKAIAQHFGWEDT